MSGRQLKYGVGRELLSGEGAGNMSGQCMSRECMCKNHRRDSV